MKSSTEEEHSFIIKENIKNIKYELVYYFPFLLKKKKNIFLTQSHDSKQ